MSDSVQHGKTQLFRNVAVNVKLMEQLIEAATGSSLVTHLAAAEALYGDSDGYDHNSECDP
jgi:hypothetical protein